MDWAVFADRLADAIASELAAKEDALRDRVLRSLALDVHPWHGHIGLAALTDRDPTYDTIEDQREDMAGWELFDLPRGRGRWPRVRELEDWMGVMSVGRGPDSDDEPRTAAQQAEADRAALEASARALDDPRVTAALARFRLSPDFERFVGHPDDSKQRNLCRSAP